MLTATKEINETRFHNQLDLVNLERLANTNYLMVGAGAIGSFLATTLAKMGAQNITVFDHDSVEDHNIANQMFPEYMVGTPKVDALYDVTESYSGIKITKHNERFRSDYVCPEGTWMISAVDNMDVRAELFKYAKTHNVRYFFDGRMGALLLRAYSIDMQNKEEVEFYEKTLYSQAKARPERCTAKSIIFTVLLVGGFLLDMIKKRINEEKCPKEVIYDSTNSYYCRSITGEEIIENETE